MAGIHLHPHDILDEGTDAILRRLDALPGVDLLFVEINTIFERNPYPSGTLPHNPVHDVVQGTGTLHVHIPPPRSRVFQRVDESITAGADPLRTIVDATRGSRYRVIPWVNVLNGDFTGARTDNTVVDFRGERVEHWLCPNAPEVTGMWKETLSAIRASYGLSTFLIDRIRYPDWAGKQVSPRGLFTCFCAHCERALGAADVDAEAVKARLTDLVARLKAGEFDAVADALLDDPLLKRWQTFRQASVTRLVERMQSDASGGGDDAAALWLDLWPPAYSWILGQDYASLTRVSSTLKHFPYHKLGGGADVQGLIEYVAQNDEAREHAFAAFKRLFSLPFDLTYREFKAEGFPIEFVRQQNDRVRELSQPGTVVYSGIQMWNIEPAALLDAIAAADASACDDLIYYCYGWADERLLDAAGGRNPGFIEKRMRKPGFLNRTQRWQAFFLLFVTMFLLGGIQNTKGLILEHVQRDIDLNLGQVGTLVAVFQIGFLVASLLAGYLTDSRGLKATMMAGSLMMVAGLVGTSLAATVLFFLGFYLIIGLGIGAMLVSIVTIIPTFYKERAGMMFNVSNAMFGVGMIVMPLVLQALFSHQISWRRFYVGLAVVVAVIIAVLSALKLERGTRGEMRVRDLVGALARRDLLLVVVFLLFYVAAEASFLNFFPIFYGALDISGASVDEKAATAAYVISSFAFLFTLGRFIGGFITVRLGDRATLIGFSFFALLAVIVGRLLVDSAVYTFMVFGFALSVLFPTASAVASKLTDKSGSVMGLIYVASGLGGALAGYIVGHVSGAFGISVGFDVIIGFVAMVAGLSLLVGREARG